MSVYRELSDLPEFNNPVLTIGSFDGVHHGHRAILNYVANAARQSNGESVLITFEPHPRKIIHPDKPLGLLTSLEQKIKLVKEAGIDHVVVVPFSREFSMMSAEDYIEHFLWANFQPVEIVLGYDHHFGHDRKGDINLLKEKLSVRVKISEIPAQLIDDAAVSSSKIRNAVLGGKVAIANEMLERPYSFYGVVVHGEKLGKKIGCPTANIRLNDSDVLVPADGVYIVLVAYKNRLLQGMMSIGVRPTINAQNIRSIEVNILDFDEEIYGQNLEIKCLKYIRPEEKFDNIDNLILKIKEDEQITRTYFSEND